MKIVLFGASGKTGSLLTEAALAEGYEVVAYVRNAASVKSVHQNLQVVAGQLNEKDQLTSVIRGADACISTLGGASLTKHSRGIMEGIDNIVSIMEAEQVKRLIYLSSIGVGESRYYMPQPIRFLVVDLMLRVPMADHNVNETHITRSQLQYTIVRPGGLTDGPKTGNLKHGSESIKIKGNSSISRANVAAFLLEQVESKEYLNKGVWLRE
jgi:putative NADH-flavin reductase